MKRIQIGCFGVMLLLIQSSSLCAQQESIILEEASANTAAATDLSIAVSVNLDATAGLELLDKAFVKDGKLDLMAVIDHFEDLYRSTSSISVAELTVTRPRRTRTLSMKIWTRGEEKSLVLIESPAREKGTATLKVDKNLWNYLPRIKRTIRIPPSMMLSSWMGSDVTNDDIVRESSYTDDYYYEWVGRSEEPDGWLIRFVAKPDMIGLWEKIDLVLTLSGRLPVKANYYDRKGRLSRTIAWDNISIFDGREIPALMTLTPLDKEEHKTEILYRDIKFDVEVPDSTFSLSRLEQQR